LIRSEFNFFVSLFSQVKNCEGKVTVSIVRRCARRRHIIFAQTKAGRDTDLN